MEGGGEWKKVGNRGGGQKGIVHIEYGVLTVELMGMETVKHSIAPSRD